MALPLILIGLATLAASVVTYGTHPFWAQFPRGLQWIVFSRQFQWPLIALSIVLCVAFLGLVAAGRRRAWWLIGLGPVLALFGHRFAPNHARQLGMVVENPSFLTADQAKGLGEQDYVVGVCFAGGNYAYPYSVLFSCPVVIHADREKRMMLMWSAYANRAVAVAVSRDLRARNLEVVSTPANALLLYESRRGAFINGLKGQDLQGQRPRGFGGSIPTAKMPWKDWRALHPDTKVMDQMLPGRPNAPTRPIPPTCPMPAGTGGPDRLITLVGSSQPSAVLSDSLGKMPLNLTADGMPVLLYRETEGQAPLAFDRRVGDLRPRFRPNDSLKHPGAIFIDADTGSGWNAAGVWVDGPKQFKGRKLASVLAEDDLYWNVMKFWYPDLQLAKDPGPAAETVVVKPTPLATSKARIHRSLKSKGGFRVNATDSTTPPS